LQAGGRRFDPGTLHHSKALLTRIGAPGSSWNDQERARWQVHQAEASREILERSHGSEEERNHRAISGLMADDRRRITGNGDLERSLDAEFEKLDMHNQNAPHKKAMAKELVEEFEQTHTATAVEAVSSEESLDELERDAHAGRTVKWDLRLAPEEKIAWSRAAQALGLTASEFVGDVVNTAAAKHAPTRVFS
jgi:hypothetical protein